MTIVLATMFISSLLFLSMKRYFMASFSFFSIVFIMGILASVNIPLTLDQEMVKPFFYATQALNALAAIMVLNNSFKKQQAVTSEVAMESEAEDNIAITEEVVVNKVNEEPEMKEETVVEEKKAEIA